VQLAISLGELGPDEQLSDGLRLAADSGVTGVEYWYPANHGATDSADFDLEMIAQRGLTTVCISTPTQLGTGHRYPADAEILREAIGLAGRHDIGLVNTYFGYPEAEDDAGRIAQYRERVLPVVQAAAQAGVTLVLENEFDCFGLDHARADLTRRPDALGALVAAIDSPHFGLTFDACNAFFAQVRPLEDFLRPLLGSVRYVHVKDGRRQPGPITGGWRPVTDSGQRFQTCPLGNGEVGWSELLAYLAAHQYSGWYTSEPHAEPATRNRSWLDLTERLHSCAAANSQSKGTVPCA
jgi:sugar phosphate isomerase/epimerase